MLQHSSLVAMWGEIKNYTDLRSLIKKKMYEDIATDGMDKNITPNVNYCKSQTVLSHAGKGIHGIFQLFQQMGHVEHLENLKSTTTEWFNWTKIYVFSRGDIGLTFWYGLTPVGYTKRL